MILSFCFSAENVTEELSFFKFFADFFLNSPEKMLFYEKKNGFL